MNKIQKSIRLDPDIYEDLERFRLEQGLNFSQAINLALASFFQSTGSTKYTKEILKRIVDKL